MDKPIYLQLSAIQQELKAPKGQTNSFGNYKYRSCEDILESVKPLLGGAVLLISDEIVLIGDRYYVKATATFTDGKDSIFNSAYARESLEKKGMDSSQVTGATSSYARKYALNGLFAIDDTKDADTQDNTSVSPQNTPKKVTNTISDEVCPLCGGELIEKFSEKTRKTYLKCSNGTFINGVAGGCKFFQEIKPIGAEEPNF